MIMLIITFPDYTLDFPVFTKRGGYSLKGGVFFNGITLISDFGEISREISLKFGDLGK